MNRPFTDVSEEISPMARELHVEAVYDILKEIRDEFQVLISRRVAAAVHA